MTYHDHYQPAPFAKGEIIHSWRDFTNARLTWLYGPDHAETRRAATDADLRAWRRLGRGRAA